MADDVIVDPMPVDPVEPEPKPVDPESTPDPIPDPVPDPVPTPEPEPLPQPKPKIWVKLKGADAAPIQVEEDATTVELPIEAFEPVVPEVWENVTRESAKIVNNGEGLAYLHNPNKPFGFILEDGVRWAWEGDCLKIERRKS